MGGSHQSREGRASTGHTTSPHKKITPTTTPTPKHPPQPHPTPKKNTHTHNNNTNQTPQNTQTPTNIRGNKRRAYISLDLGGDPLYLELETVYEDFKPVERTVRVLVLYDACCWGDAGKKKKKKQLPQPQHSHTPTATTIYTYTKRTQRRHHHQVEMRSSRRTLGYREVEKVLPLNAQVLSYVCICVCIN